MKRSIAKHTAVSLACLGWLTAGAIALAQEAPQRQDPYSQDQYSRTSPDQSTNSSSTDTTRPGDSKSDHHRAMKDCVARERADNSGLSESQAKKACHDAMKAEKRNPDHEPQQPQ
jgi:hypothetical protein